MLAHLDKFVSTAAGQPLAVRGELDTGYGLDMRLQRAESREQRAESRTNLSVSGQCELEYIVGFKSGAGFSRGGGTALGRAVHPHHSEIMLHRY